MSDHPFYQAPYGKGPLQGLRVLEATQAVAGPMAGTILGDLGAEVIRCELPGRGDVIRPIPPCLDPDQPLESGTWYQSVNRGKKAVTLDIRKPEGQELFRQLAAKVDVVIENFVPGTMPAWGLDYASLKAVNPGLIYLSISGFGLWGPLAKRRGMDSVIQAMSGMMSVTGEAGGRPLITGMPIVDHITGWQGAIGILAALAHREKTGKGQQVDVSLADTALAVSDHQLMSTVNTDFVGQLKGNGTPQGGPADTYVCKDGRSVFIFALLDAMWQRFCEVIERPDLIDDSRCKSLPARAKNREFVDGIVGEWAAKRTSFEVEEILEGAGVTVGRVMDYTEVSDFEQYRQHEAIVDIEHPEYGKLSTFGTPAKFSETPCKPEQPAPKLGQHNREIYGELLGMDPQEEQRLKELGIV